MNENRSRNPATVVEYPLAQGFGVRRFVALAVQPGSCAFSFARALSDARPQSAGAVLESLPCGQHRFTDEDNTRWRAFVEFVKRGVVSLAPDERAAATKCVICGKHVRRRIR